MAHSEPLVMVVAQVVERARGSRSTSRPAMIRSMRLDAARRADPARRALAARLLGAELHREPRHPRHVDGVVEDHDAAVADHRARPRRTPRSPSAGRTVGRQVGAERAADLDGPHRPAGQRAAAVVLDELAQGDAERQLDDAAAGDVARPAGRPGCRGTCRRPSSAYAAPPSARIIGTAHEREHVVDDGRLAEQALERGDRRLGAHLAAAALEALQHRGLLAADVGTGAHPHVQVEGEPAAQDVARRASRGCRRSRWRDAARRRRAGYSERT